MAEFLDYRTIAIVLTVKCLFQALGLGYVWYLNRKFGPARDWALGWLSVGCGAALFAIYPDDFVVPLALGRAVLIFLGLYIVGLGLLRACAGGTAWRLFSAMTIVALVAHFWFTLGNPSVAARFVNFCLFVACGSLYVAGVALRAPRGPLRGTQRLIALLLLAYAFVAALRAFSILATDSTATPFATPAQMVFLLTAISTSLLLALLLAVLTSQQTNALLAATLDNLNHGVAMFDADQKLIVCNERYGRMYGLSACQVKPGMHLKTIIAQRIERGVFSDDKAEYYREYMEPVSVPSTKLHQLSDGRGIAVSRRPMQGGGWVATHEDVTAYRRIQSQLVYMAHHDALTGLANRLIFMRKMNEAVARLHSKGEEFCLVLLDLDRFKAVNDSCGHPVGDALLKTVARRLHTCTRPTDTIARLGGDEFAIIRTDAAIRRDEIIDLANRLLRAIAAPYDLAGRKVTIGTSIGIALAPHDAVLADHLMQKADLALYRAKSEGRNCHRFYLAEMDLAAQARATVERALRKADLSEKFNLHYRPIVDGATGELRAAAAVAAWCAPDDTEAVHSIALMDVAEECGLASNFGKWILQQACRAAVAWPRHVKLAVDVTPAQFAQWDFVDVVCETLADSGLPAQRLVLRVTEACVAEDAASRRATLRELKDHGIAIVLADFGGGGSSLEQLIAFPYDHIAIGATFVADIARRPDCAAIVSALTGFASSLGVAAIAEDVVTAEQFKLLRAAGCSQFRGPLFDYRSIGDLKDSSGSAKVA
jgi:diguanylate cyclase (GGDEF)-like protein